MMLACELDPDKFETRIYERNAAPGRKFLVAGDGGLNLTHSEDPGRFTSRYTPPDLLSEALAHFSNRQLVHWFHDLGIETYVGSSGRVFPLRSIKPIAVLNSMLKRVEERGVSLHLKQEWKGFSEHGLLFTHNGAISEVRSDLVIFCLGGASWPVTGSDGGWRDHFAGKGITVRPFQPSNCAFTVSWPEAFVKKEEGGVLKNIITTCNGVAHAGEVVITKTGLEGSGIYPLSPQIREQLQRSGTASIDIDLKPAFTAEKLEERLSGAARKNSLTQSLRTELKLGDTAVQLLKHSISKEEFLDVKQLCQAIKHLRVTITGTGLLEEAISTVGGIALGELDRFFQLKQLPGHFAVGEMLDYDAPTGGYLLQSCFSMAKFLADHLNHIA